MGKSWSSVVQEDKSVATAGDAQNVIGSGASQINPIGTSVVVSGAPNTTLGDITVNQFPEQVEKTVGALVGSVNKTTEALGATLAQQQLGEASQLPRIILYIGLGIVAVVALKAFIR